MKPIQNRLILGKSSDGRRKNLSSLSLIDPSPKQARKASIQIPKQKENIPDQNKYRSQNNDDLKKQISALIKKSNLKRKLDMVCEEQVIVEEVSECGFDEQTLRYLQSKEQEYRVSALFFDCQEEITPIMRAILLDWLMEVCKEFTLKRETFHLSVHNLDRYLQKKRVFKKELQLLGLAVLYISCKIEEIYPPKVSDFSQASNYGFSNEQIMEKELEVLSVLKWMINPPSLYLWTTWYLSQWDLFHKQSKLLFKKPNQQSYVMFRQYMGFIDCIVLDSRHHAYSHRELVAALLYLVLLKHHNMWTYQKVAELKEIVDFQMIKQFLETIFGINLQTLLKPIRYLQRFMTLEISVDQPGSSKIPAEKEYEEAYEYFLSIQTHNTHNLAFIRGL